MNDNSHGDGDRENGVVRFPARGRKKAAKPAVNLEKQVEGGLLLGEVEDFFAHVGVIAMTLQRSLAVGDTIRIKGHTTDITQKIESMQIDHQFVQAASAKDAVGIRIVDRARKGDAKHVVGRPGERRHLFPGRQVPDLHRLVVGAGGDPLSVPADGHAPRLLGVPVAASEF